MLHLPKKRRLVPYGNESFWDAIAANREFQELLPGEFRSWRRLPDSLISAVAFQFRMGAGAAGEISRTHPVGIEPVQNDATNPVLGYGLACVYTASGNTVRQMASGDSSLTNISGILNRPFPQQAATAAQQYGGTGTVVSPFGANPAPPVGQPVDLLKQGYIIVPVNGTPVKGGAVYVWVAASSAPHVQGAFETSATGGSTMAIETDGRTYFNGPPDAFGNCELAFNL